MMKKKLPAVRALTVLSALTALLLVATTFAGCAGAGANSGDVIGSSEAASSSQEESQASESSVTEVPAESSEVAAEAFVFIHSDGIDENGFWDGVKALDHVELPEYEGLTIPADVHTVSEEAIQSEVDGLLANYTTENQVTDRAVVDGDTVNIDYVGSVDGVEFEGGNTQGGGTSVTIGVTQYIDDFLEQIIGHTPGETFNVEVTFPEDYGQDHLNGKDAVFVTTVNYVVETVQPELTDAFVAENFSESDGWNTVADMKESIGSSLRDTAIQQYLQQYLLDNSTVTDVPPALLTYQEGSLLSYYQDYATQYGMALDDFLTTFVGVASRAELLETYKAENEEMADFSLIIQAVAEDAGLTVTKEDIDAYFHDYIKVEDYSQFEEQYGEPFLKMSVLNKMVMDHIEASAVMG